MKLIRLIKENTVLRLAELSDADFILSLRSNENLNKYLSSVENNLEAQIDWLKNYKMKEAKGEEYYFIIEDKERKAYGTIRLYAIKDNECTWGSFILLPDRPFNFSYISAELSFDFAFNTLGMKSIKLDVNKKNSKAIHIYFKLGFKKLKCDEKNLYMVLTKEMYKKNQWRINE